MEQEKFTELVISKFQTILPGFIDALRLNDDKSADLECQSKSGKLKLILTTFGNEITLGFAAQTGKLEWHIHMNMYGAETPGQELEIALELVTEIIKDKRRIVYSSELGYFLTEDVDDLDDFIYDGEKLELVYWSEL
ncbi:hypothetical protein [Rufibacter hautae]|uniref:Uncharacterized protein n=1 Tax=Rufibacter hautae TaxID=2595005 RepID=A0A5B6TL63_9BACT|nr:hypothetical protein [Rufibacter hautae]KAA3436832.1 hypothetical protein FOA19_20880 [Rufibacter hautae]